MRLGRGGYAYVYDILDGTEVIGTKWYGRDQLRDPVRTVYKLRGNGEEFRELAAFKRAYEEIRQPVPEPLR